MIGDRAVIRPFTTIYAGVTIGQDFQTGQGASIRDDNVIGDGEVAAILDLEEAWVGPCAFDLVMAFVGFGWDSGRPVEERWDALVSGYESFRNLTNPERAALAVLHRNATLSIAAWRLWKQ